MAGNTITLTPVSDQDIEELENLLREMKNRAGEANDKGNVIMLSVYAELVKKVSPEVQRLRARVEREEKAAINKHLQATRKAHREAAESAA
jgi:phage host-nuclease inhibitor protein Gam